MAGLPTVAELIASVKDLTRADGSLQAAWSESFPDGYHCCEQGGFIYIDYPIPARITRAYIVRAPAGKVMNQRTMGPNASIDLNSPGIKNDNVILVANFHTHPLSTNVQGNPRPSPADITNSYARGLPGIVLSRDGIYSYGPDTRAGFNNPKGYPGPVAPPGGIPPVVLERPSPPPTTVKNQWPEGTNLGFALEQTEDGEGASDVVCAEWSRKGVQYGRPLVD